MVSEGTSRLSDLADHDFMAPGSVLLAPRSNTHPSIDSRWHVITYVGDFRDPDGDVQIGDDFYVQQQSYAVSEFVPVGGPTILRANSTVDRAAFFRDADIARSTGKFPPALLHPQSLVGDMPTLGFAPSTSEVSHAFLSDSGDVSTSPFGIPLGSSSTASLAWSKRWVEALHEVGRQPEIADRPWISRYFLAVDALRHATVRGLQRMRVSGFGGHLVPTLDGVEEPPASLPSLLLFNGEVAHLHDSASSRTYKLGADAAKFVDIMLTVGTDAASAARLLGCSESLAAASISQIADSFAAEGIRVTVSDASVRS